jgi:hypothetical protein
MDNEAIAEKIDALCAAFAELRTFIEDVLLTPHRPAPDGLVGVEYVAALFDCSLKSVRTGKAGTSHVRWITRRPLKCERTEAHAALARFVASRAPRAKRLINRKSRT